MAFTRSTIRNLAKDSGVELPKELEDALVSEHLTARDAYAEEQVKAELAKQPTEKAGNVKDSEEYKTLKQSFDDYKAEVAAKETKAAKEAAYRAILKDANLSEKGIEKAIKYAEWDKIELEADGKLKGASDHIKSVKEEWAEYVTTTTTTGAKTSNPPANNGNSGVTKEDFQKMSYKDRLQIYNENPDLYNELTT
jgi:predicted ribosome quality control (RQC) complex YloA/Tae2 family protein